MLFAAACVALVSCDQKEQLPAPLESGKLCTLTATINLDQSTQTKIAPDLANITTELSFNWEIGDKVTISNESGTESEIFTVQSVKDGVASLTGKALTDMSSYKVTYGDAAATTITYQEDTFKPIASGTGADLEFTIDSYFPVLHLTLTGAIKVDSIKYYVEDDLKTTLKLSKDFALNSTEKTVYFPVLSEAGESKAKLEFCNSDGLIKTQTISCAIAKGDFISFPTLDVRGYIKIFTKYNNEDWECKDSGILTTILGKKDDACTVTARFFPEDIPATNITWSSNNDYVLTIDENGTVTRHTTDKDTNTSCTITCSEKDGTHTAASFGGSYCFAAGTRITMADGSTKKVEDIVEGDLVRTFDHEAGKISSSKICLTYKGENQAASLDLTFASGKKLSIVGTHDLLLENTRKYVRVNSGNVASFVGKRFYNAETGAWDALVSYATGAAVDYYCIYSAKHLNCVAEGMITCPDDVDHILNIYELDSKLKADVAKLAADKAQYGLCDIAKDFPEFAQYADQIEALGGQYLYIAIGKGLVPSNYIESMKAYWTGK